MNLKTHVKNCVKTASHNLYRLRRIRKYLNKETASKLVNAFITCRLDYCNSILYKLPVVNLIKLQNIQNSAARLITHTNYHSHITPVLKELHWLPITTRIKFKILLLTFKCLKNGEPQYLQNLLSQKMSENEYSLRTSRKGNLREIRTNLSYGDRSFAASAPKLWNSLPNEIKCEDSITKFKKKLKYHLFCECYNN